MAVPLVAVAAMVFYWTYFRNADVMWQGERLSLFLYSRLFFAEKMTQAGGLLQYAGCFLTQFFHHPLAGCALFTLLCVGLSCAVAWAFRLGPVLAGLAVLPPVAATLSATELGYMLYVMKLPGHLCVPLVGLTLIALLYGLYARARLSRRWATAALRCVLLAAFSALYAFMGVYALALTACCVLHELLQGLTSKEQGPARLLGLAPVAVAALGFRLVPVLSAKVYTGLNDELLYRVGLPDFAFEGGERALWMPFALMLASLALATVASQLAGRPALHDSRGRLRRPVLALALALAAGSTGYGLHALSEHSCKDDNFHTAVSALRAAEEGDWYEVISRTAGAEQPTRAIVMLRNLALVKTGQAADRMFAFTDGDAPFVTPREMPAMRLLCSRILYFHYGQVNNCYRWAMEDKVEYGLTADYLIYMVRCALAGGEWQLARKYIHTLRQTLFYRDLAARYEAVAGDSRRTAQLEEMKGVAPLMAFTDLLDSDKGMVEYLLLGKFMNTDGVNEPQVNLSLLSSLVYKQHEAFWHHLALYAKYHQTLPVHYQEAALMFGWLQKLDVSRLPITDEVRQRFKGMEDLIQAGVTENDAHNPMVTQKAGGTYWYYYFFVNGLKIN